MNIEKIAKEFHKLPDKQRQRFFKNLSMLFDQEFSALSLREPFRMVLDSNILMRLEDIARGSFSEGILAILCYFDYFKAQKHFHANLLIRPVVFYEFHRNQVSGSLSEHWKQFQKLLLLLETELQIEIRFDEDIPKFETAKSLFEIIRFDTELIKCELQNISLQEWDFDFIRSPNGIDGVLKNDGSFEAPPISAAEYLLNKTIMTKYFDPSIVRLFFRDHIAFKLANNPNNNLEVAKKYEPPDNYSLRKVLFLKKNGELRGLGDVDIFSTCNASFQFSMQSSGNYFPASIPLTMDDNLFYALQNYANVLMVSDEIIGGEPISEMSAKLEGFFDDARRRSIKVKSQKELCLKAQSAYINSIANFF